MGRLLSRLANRGLSPFTPNSPQVIAANCAMPTFKWDGVTASSDAKTRTETRKSFRTGREACTSLRTAYAMFFDNGAAGEAAIGNDVIIESAIELSTVATAQRAFLDGASTSNMVDRNPLKVSNPPIPYYIPAASDIFVRSGMVVAAAANSIPAGGNARTASGDVGYRNTSGSSRVFGAGYINSAGDDVYFDAMGPFMVLGIPQNPMVAAALMGDSYGEGQGDTLSTTTGVKGYMQRGLYSVNGFAVPSVNISKGSEMAQNQTMILGSRKRAAWPYVTHLLCALGRNDIGTGRTLAQVQADLTSIWTAAKLTKSPYGRALHVSQVSIPPSTTSTDSWATAANQTPTTGFASGGIRDQLNTWIAAQVGQGLLDAYVNLNSTQEDPNNPGKWITTGAANYATTDGIHMTTAIHINAATVLNTWAASLTP